MKTATCVCAHDCPDACSIRVGLRDGKITSIGGDPHHPFTRGFLCGKVNRYAERVYSSERIKTPLRRVGPKGEARFEPITWDEALEEVARRFTEIISQHGAEAILPYSYGGNLGKIGFNIGHRFFHALGATRLDRTICTGSANAGLRMTGGPGLCSPIEAVTRSKLILIWGQNTVATHIHLMPLIQEARKRGARLVVIDTYRTATARQADTFILVRPGTDGALALGMMRIMLAEGLYDSAFVDRHTLGLEELRQACEPWTPEAVQHTTGVSPDQLMALARDYGGEPSAFIRLGIGISRRGNGGMTVRTIACLPALSGAYEAPGGGLHSIRSDAAFPSLDFLTRLPAGWPRARTLNMIRLGEALLETREPPIWALYVYNANPAAVVPEQGRVHQGLAREDLFVVVHEQFLTDTAAFADIVLPATTFMEHDDLLTSYGHDYLQLSRAAIPPIGEARSNLETFARLAEKLGLEDPVLNLPFEALVEKAIADVVWHPDETDPLNRFLAGNPVRLNHPEKPWRNRLSTTSGKFEFFSSRMEKQGLPAVPVFVPSAEGHLENELKARYPLQLLTPPSQHFLNSSFGESPSSRRLEKAPRLKISPTDATARNLAEGSLCRVFNDRGECFLEVEATDQVPPGVVVAESIWWPGLMRERKGINQLTSAELTDMGRGARFHDVLVQVEATGQAGNQPTIQKEHA